jgi:hypothetical protein
MLVVGLILFLCLFIWMGYLSLFNLWAGGGPPNNFQEQYKTWGNIYSVLALFSLGVVIWLAIRIFKR